MQPLGGIYKPCSANVMIMSLIPAVMKQSIRNRGFECIEDAYVHWPKSDPCRHRYSIKLNDVDNALFLAMVNETGRTDKAKFIKYVKLDKVAMDYYVRLTTFHSQFRAIGVNYNQVVKHLKTVFTIKTALALLYKLEKATIELVATNKQIVDLTKEFEEKHLLK